MWFNTVADYFQRIDRSASRLDMTQLLAELFVKLTADEAEIVANFLLGQLHPPYIDAQFNIAVKNMIKVIAILQDTTEDDVTKRMQECGDLGLVVEQISWPTRATVSVVGVYKQLVAIEGLRGTGSSDDKNQLLIKLIEQCDAVSAKYIVRIILGKLRLGFSDMTLLDALSWMLVGDKSLKLTLEHAYNVCADIGLIAKEAKQNGIQGIKEMKVHVGVPIRPSAAERMPTAQAIIDKLGTAIAQPKLDGFRLQIHIDNTNNKHRVWFFSRNLIDMSHMFPDVAHVVARLPVKTLICEGEAIVFDQNTQQFLPFQETVKRKRKHDIQEVMEELPLRVYLFDLLYIDGTSVMHETHEERRARLLAIMKGYDNNALHVINEQAVDTGKQLLDYFQENISSGLEGVVVKRPNAPYVPGKRNFNWIKLKREEKGHLQDTIDCVILGYYYGEGKRSLFGIGAFLVGVYSPKHDRFETIAKIGTGLKDQDWRDLKQTCDSLRVDGKPKNVVCAESLYPDIWIAPETVCAIRADEITLSPVHTANKTEEHAGFALRFPRFMGYRLDKSAEEATTIAEVKRLFEIQKAK